MQNVRHRLPTSHPVLALLLAALLALVVQCRQALPAAAVTAPTLDLTGYLSGNNREMTVAE